MPTATSISPAARSAGQRCARLSGLAARQQRNAHAERFEPGEQIARVLVGEQFGRRHECGLEALFDRAQGRERRDDGLAGPDIALHEPHHRVRPFQVVRDFQPDAALRRGELERQVVETALDEIRAAWQRQGAIAIGRLAQQSQAQLMREQFLEGETPLRRVHALRRVPARSAPGGGRCT